MPLRFAALMLAGLALAGCGGPSAPAGGKPAAPAPDIQWGEAVNGLQAGLAVKSPPAGPESRATLLVAVRNVGAKPVKIMKVAKIDRGSQALVFEIKSEGKTCHWVGPQIQPPPIMAEDFRELAPGAVDSAEQVFAPGSWGPDPKDRKPLKPPFKAEIVFRYSWQGASVEAGPWKADKSGTIVDGLWTGEARSKPVEVEASK